MRVLIVIAVLIGAAFVILLVLTKLARDLSRNSYHSPPDLDDSDDWDVALDELDDTAPPEFPCAEQWRASQNRIAHAQGYKFPGTSNALDDLRSAL